MGDIAVALADGFLVHVDHTDWRNREKQQPLLFSGGRGDEPVVVREKPPRIIYTSRTHSQLTQVMKELKRTAYSPRMSTRTLWQPIPQRSWHSLTHSLMLVRSRHQKRCWVADGSSASIQTW
jgi:hypothetical protein